MLSFTKLDMIGVFSPPTADPDLYYVPVIRAADNSLIPYLGSPCKMEGQQQQSAEENGASMRETLLPSPVIGHALAGPMSETKVSPSSRYQMTTYVRHFVVT